MSFLSMLGGRLRVAGCGGSLVVTEAADEPCCCGKCGCTNPYSPNFDPEAELDDGSCETCCNQGRCIVEDESPCKGSNCNPIGNGCCDSGCLPCEGTGRDCSDTFDNSFEPEKFCPGTEEFTYHDCYSCPQSIRASDDKPVLPAFLELQQILESRVGGPYASPDERRKLTLLPQSVATPYDPTGPGTVLSKIFALFGLRATPQCVCTFRAYVMDVMGCRWCVQNTALITRWLEQEARRRGVPYARFLGACAVLCAVIVSSVCGLLFKKRLQYG
jgi:hypothetical protein